MKQCAVQAKPSEAEQDRLPRRAFLGAVGVAGFALAAPSVGQRGDQVPSLARPSGPADIVSRDESVLATGRRTLPRLQRIHEPGSRLLGDDVVARHGGGTTVSWNA